MDWIKTEDSLPEENAIVLLYSENYGINIGRLISKDIWSVGGISGGPNSEKRKPSHWMHLPEDPK